ncbi:starch phosphorylase [Brevinema andersonii]|uniref:Alpha-1,4 glucan phosphorylase n=1 Tax=Brevinema andersonii TaxID=34097 RepID=A0A1I1DYX6_BREAD|nr:glycogen/starch/alpha-glucan phosphorylase [Brevinema andersonii]SFB79592.1 starch phosphorylase [Brevinema andersonii]
MHIPFDKNVFKEAVLTNIKERTGKTPEEATSEDIYQAVSEAIMAYIAVDWTNTKNKIAASEAKQAFYFSAEFLMGRAFDNNIINFGLQHGIIEMLEDLHLDLNLIEDQEPDAALGNGGLGRLAACFLDSLATMGYAGHGYGIRYKYGMFEQKIQNGYQVEAPDNWLKKGDPWEVRRDSDAVYVKFGGRVDNVMEDSGRIGFRRNNAETIIAVPYDMPIIGYKNGCINTLRLWQAQAPEPFDLTAFNNGEFEQAVVAQNNAENISRVLYPNDYSYQGKELRLRQQYFFTSASLQDIITKFVHKYGDHGWEKFPEKVAIQLNDTHPVVAIPELMRLFMDWKGLDWDFAWQLTTQTFAYTNHTVLAEALEVWDLNLFRGLLPRIYQIVEEINRRFMDELRTKYPNDHHRQSRMSILDHGQIKMAHLAIVGSHSVNGVAKLHTQILEREVLKDWYELYPEKFQNKTNGITPRRWLVKANPKLTTLIDSKIGESWKTNLDELQKLKQFIDDQSFLEELMRVKQENKITLTNYIKYWTDIELNPHAIFDVQVKRMHEYKRQLLNALQIIAMYLQLRENPAMDIYPRAFIFGGKAASGYWRAKTIIKLINNIANVINQDNRIQGKLKVVFVPNYRVSVAEKIFPGADVSEQISTAGKEASGTGNMKFMANGAITIGTLDGANVEILEEVGAENCVIFGATTEEIHELNINQNYQPLDYYHSDPLLKDTLDSLINGTFTIGEDENLFRNLYDSLLYGVDGNPADTYYLLKDFDAYRKAQGTIDLLYRDRNLWAKMMLINIASCGKFSSDRTIQEYADEIWHIKPLT